MNLHLFFLPIGLSGTSECHQLAHDFLQSWGEAPNEHGAGYEVISGNHDLEGIDEFPSDEENLAAFLRIHQKPRMQFMHQVGPKTLLIGLGSTVFRAAQYTSHEVTVDMEQMSWFKDTLESHPAEDGWQLFVFTHAPPMGSGLRVLQNNHVVNGCCWLNHSGENVRDFIALIRKYRAVKAWFSGHFHLGQDYEDSITYPSQEANRGSCVFAQVSVMRAQVSRDRRQQSRLLRGNSEGFEIATVNHLKGGEVRIDASVQYKEDGSVTAYAHDSEDFHHPDYMHVYIPAPNDGCYVPNAMGVLTPTECTAETTQWWHMQSGTVLGVHGGMLLEYDRSTLAPLGLVVGPDELNGRLVAVIDSSPEACAPDKGVKAGALNLGEVVEEAYPFCAIECKDDANANTVGLRGSDCGGLDAASGEQAVVLYHEDADGRRYDITVVQPNEDGSYWRKIVRNKMHRMKEKRREQAAALFAKQRRPDETPMVVSSWGPYTSFVGTAKTTGVPGVTLIEEDKCESRRARSRRLLPHTSPAVPQSELGWHEEWQERLQCWWGALPGPTQNGLGACLGSLSILLGSRLEQALGRLGRTPTQSSARPAAEAGCEWLDNAAETLEMPEFPDLDAFRFSLPPIPRLLPSIQQLELLSQVQLQLAEAVNGDSTPITAGVGAGVGAGAAAFVLSLGAVFLLGKRVDRFALRRTRSAHATSKAASSTPMSS